MKMFSTLLLCLLFAINVNCNQWDGYHRQIDDKLPAISWKDCGISARKSDPTLIPNISINTRIEGGVFAKSGEYPWFALIERDGWGICGGSIINEWWILTAGHCVDAYYRGSKNHSYSVLIGSVDRYPARGVGRRIEVERIFIQKIYVKYEKERYEEEKAIQDLKEELIILEMNASKLIDNEFQRKLNKYEYEVKYVERYSKPINYNKWFFDISLLKLKERVVPVFNETHYVINSICLPKTGINNTKDEILMIIGMGIVKMNGSASLHLKKGIARMKSSVFCAKRHPYGPYGAITRVCMKRFTDRNPLIDAGTCQGDSGSPSHQYYGWKAVQIGIVSTGDHRRSNCGTDSKYVRVSLFMDWIRFHVLKNVDISRDGLTIEAETNHLLIVSVITVATIAVILSSVFLWILVKILRERHRNA